MTKLTTAFALLIAAAMFAASAHAGCVGDCGGDGEVTVDELVLGVNIALGTTPLSQCASFDTGNDGEVTVDELVAAVNAALTGCPFTGQFYGTVALSGSQVGKVNLVVQSDGHATGTLTITDGAGAAACADSDAAAAAVIGTVSITGSVNLDTGAFSLTGTYNDTSVTVSGTLPALPGGSGTLTVAIGTDVYSGSITTGDGSPTPTPTSIATSTATATGAPPTSTPTPTATPSSGPPPSGQRLVLSAPPAPATFNEIFVMNLDGSGKLNLTNSADKADYTPAWNADGTKIAWASGALVEGGLYYHIFVMNADGSGKTDLMPANRGDARHPSWSPDGTKIVFQDLGRIAVIDADGSGEHTIISEHRGLGAPDWSSDGGKIAFVARLHLPSGNSGHNDDDEIYVMNPDGSSPTRLTNNTYQDEFPAWRPDGNKIAFGQIRPGVIRVHLINPDGSGDSEINLGFFGGSNVAWSQDGSQFAYHNLLGLHVVNADGSGDVTVTNDLSLTEFDLK